MSIEEKNLMKRNKFHSRIKIPINYELYASSGALSKALAGVVITDVL